MIPKSTKPTIHVGADVVEGQEDILAAFVILPPLSTDHSAIEFCLEKSKMFSVCDADDEEASKFVMKWYAYAKMNGYVFEYNGDYLSPVVNNAGVIKAFKII